MRNFKNIEIASSSLTRDYRKNTCMYNSLRVIYCKGCRYQNFLQKYTFFIISCKENSKISIKKENINRIENYLNRFAKHKHYRPHTQTLSLTNTNTIAHIHKHYRPQTQTLSLTYTNTIAHIHKHYRSASALSPHLFYEF